jgi:NADPH-dependent ferric siderophore reductase
MSSAKGKLVRLLGGVLLRNGTIVEATHVGGFRRVVLRADGPTPAAGMKLQMLLPSDDMRTYTPVASPEGIVLLGWTQARGPGARWMVDATEGDQVRFIGPQRSLELPPGPVILVGDETSVAVAASFAVQRPGQVQAVFQVGSISEVHVAAESVGVEPLDVLRRGATDRTIEAVAAAHTATPDATIALTGGSELVLAVRRGLRERGVRQLKTKTYWVPGKHGLD